MRASTSEVLSTANILVRPHSGVKLDPAEGPVEKIRWRGVAKKAWVTRPSAEPRVAMVRANNPEGLHDALFHAAAVVGLNTHAALEAAIVGRPLFTLSATEEGVEGEQPTLPGRYVLAENGGCVTLANDFEEHRAQLAAALSSPDRGAELRKFARAFVRPAGWSRPAAHVLVDALEREFGVDGKHRPSAPHAAAPSARPEELGCGVVRLDFPSDDIWLHATSAAERKWRATACAKEPFTVSWIQERIANGQVLYDIGANVGAYSLIAAKSRGARVIAFEPGYATFARLCENIQLNGCEHSVVPVPLPLAESNGIVGFEYRSPAPGESRHVLVERAWQDGDGRHGARYVQPVCATTLDTAVTQFGLPSPNFMKVDVDGAELRVLKGASGVLRQPELASVLIEVDEALWNAVYEHMVDAGFTMTDRPARRKKPGAPIYAIFDRR
jgi:FkbM family methyltransferase